MHACRRPGRQRGVAVTAASRLQRAHTTLPPLRHRPLGVVRRGSAHASGLQRVRRVPRLCQPACSKGRRPVSAAVGARTAGATTVVYMARQRAVAALRRFAAPHRWVRPPQHPPFTARGRSQRRPPATGRRRRPWRRRSWAQAGGGWGAGARSGWAQPGSGLLWQGRQGGDRPLLAGGSHSAPPAAAQARLTAGAGAATGGGTSMAGWERGEGRAHASRKQGVNSVFGAPCRPLGVGPMPPAFPSSPFPQQLFAGQRHWGPTPHARSAADSGSAFVRDAALPKFPPRSTTHAAARPSAP
jgi:hypothetical protein